MTDRVRKFQTPADKKSDAYKRQRNIEDAKLRMSIKAVFEDTGEHGQNVLEWIMRQTGVLGNPADTNNLITQQNIGAMCVGNRILKKVADSCVETHLKVISSIL